MIDSLFKPEGAEDNGLIRELLLDFYISRMQLVRASLMRILDQIVKACKFLDDSWFPKFTVIVAQKNHHTRFFEPKGPRDDNVTNVPAGTVVDTGICHPRNYDFYMCAHAGMIGTTRPTHYHVLHDEIGFSPDDLQELVHSLSYVINMSNLQSNRHVIPLPEFVVHAAEGKKGSVEDMELLRELVPPRNLEHFELNGYSNVIFPTWLMDIAMYLPNLVSVCLWDITQCDSLPPLGQLPNLKRLKLVAVSSITKIDRSFCGGVKAFTRLEDFSMFRMESLEEWTTAYSKGEGGVADQFMFPNLKELEIFGCHKLRLNPRPPRVKGTWRIGESDGVLCNGERVLRTLWKLLRHLPAIKGLNIKQCNDLNSSSDIVGACSLRELTLLGCDITSLPQWLGHLTTLQKLRIRSCESLNNLPEWLGDLVSLKDLNIYDCHGIVSLPESIQRLTKLKRLTIQDCPALEQWGKLKENRRKIRHIKEVRALLYYWLYFALTIFTI
ncbi:putative disease resistance protein RGA4 [Panicum miliaceum]|uniref:Disease resistance protein RGA4 n=1 Tax=Panicum miliaceum TaxID=4540 RepID=A0A3L6SQE8_PANMI|nr:putative disease resistance protein RGA4 [Panicum miliaceum]